MKIDKWYLFVLEALVGHNQKQSINFVITKQEKKITVLYVNLISCRLMSIACGLVQWPSANWFNVQSSNQPICDCL